MGEMDKKLLQTIRYYITEGSKSVVSPRLLKIPAGELPSWAVEALGYIQIWNRGHSKDLISINPKIMDKQKVLARIAELEKKFAK